jgi:hypothetical protein
LDPVGKALNTEAARRLIELHADEETPLRVEELADRNTEGQQTAEERSAYESLVAAADIVAILQAKARSKFATEPAAA